MDPQGLRRGQGWLPAERGELLHRVISALNGEVRASQRHGMLVNLAVSLMGGARGLVELAYMLSEMNGAPGEALRGSEGLARLILEMLES